MVPNNGLSDPLVIKFDTRLAGLAEDIGVTAEVTNGDVYKLAIEGEVKKIFNSKN